MKNFLKSKWFIFIPLIILDIAVLLLATIKSGYEMTTPGGLNEVADLIEIDTKTEYDGSFNTIFVQSFDEATILQTFLAKFSDSIEVSEILPQTDYYDYTMAENIASGTIQKEQSIEASLICAYRYLESENAEVNIDFKFKGYIIHSYFKNQPVLRIGDLIVGCNKSNGDKFDLSTPKELSNALNTLAIGDTIIFLRDEKEMQYLIDEELTNEKMNRFFGYAKYEINEETIFPKYTLHKGNTLGPSGGLLQTLSVYCQLSGNDLTKGRKIAGTGTISVNGNVGAIGGIKQKIITAIQNDVDIFICPKYHEQEAMAAYLNQYGHEKMEIYFVETFQEALEVLA